VARHQPRHREDHHQRMTADTGGLSKPGRAAAGTTPTGSPAQPHSIRPGRRRTGSQGEA
jgi:hypothetical protein